MKGIRYCGECSDYSYEHHRCLRGAHVEENPRNPFYDDCPLPEVEPVQGWRPGSEPPKVTGYYIAITQVGSYPRELFWSAKRQKWLEVSDGDFDTAYAVTHWMPMPEPPEEEA